MQTYSQAEKDGVLCEFDIRLPQELWITDTEVVSLVGNILDNVLEACRYGDQRRYIRLEIVCHSGLFILKSENSTDGKVQTRKKDAINHGMGMKTIKQILEKYNGEMRNQFGPHHFALELTLFRTEKQFGVSISL